MPTVQSIRTVVIRRANGDRIEIPDLTLSDIRELFGLNGVTHPPSTLSVESKAASLNPKDFVIDYEEFTKALTPNARQFLSILRQNPNGISADQVAEHLGFESTAQIGGMVGGGMAKTAGKFGIDMDRLYTREVKFDDGVRQAIYKPGKDIQFVT